MPIQLQTPCLNNYSQFIQTKNAVPSQREEHLSPSGKYRLIITPHRTGKGSWEVTQGLVYDAKTDELIGEVHRNYSSFPFAFIEDHPETGEDYLLCGEDYQGQTIISLSLRDIKQNSQGLAFFSKGRKNIKHYLPSVAKEGHGFCWTGIHPSPKGNILAVEGCYWAHPFEIVFYDFSEPTKLPYPEICRNVRSNEDFFEWLNNSECEIGRTYERLKSTGKHEDDITLEELREIEKEQIKLGLEEEDLWEEAYDKVVFRMPEPQKKRYMPLRTKIKTLVSHGMFCRRMINATKAKERNKWWERKREVGRETRLHLIAYCLLRNKDYHKMEPKIHQEDDPRYEHFFDFYLRYSKVHGIIQEYGNEEDCNHWTEEIVKETLLPKKEKSNATR